MAFNPPPPVIRMEKLQDPAFVLEVLNWLLEENLAGREHNSVSVANHFGLSIAEANKLNELLTEAGEL